LEDDADANSNDLTALIDKARKVFEFFPYDILPLD